MDDSQNNISQWRQKMAKILIVQDSKFIGIMMKSLLEAENFFVSIAETGEAAVKKAQEENVDLILLDYELPGMNGGQVCRILKKDDKLRDIPVIFVSAKSNEEMIKITAEAGAQGFIGEKIDPEVLINTVNGYLKKNEARNSSIEVQIDKPLAAEKLGIPKELYDNIFAGFMQEGSDLILKIDEMKKEKDFEGLRQIAHFIKGTAGNLKLNEVYAAAKEIEYFDHEKTTLQLLDEHILRLKHSFAMLKKYV